MAVSGSAVGAGRFEVGTVDNDDSTHAIPPPSAKWVDIQQKTFTNWVNEQLRPTGEQVRDLRTDLCDGLRLISLVEVLQSQRTTPPDGAAGAAVAGGATATSGRRLRRIRQPLNQHQYLENVQVALNAIAADNVKLVNIGNTDVVEGNLKLILGLVWSLIVRYQIGRSNVPARKLMLNWLRAVLPPELEVCNFSTDWNSGILLSALVDYCRPGLIPDWRNLNPNNGYENCRLAMETARDELDIPIVLRPEDLASEKLDELSGMTYLSYYMNDTSAGYRAMLNWVRQHLPYINNFTTDWNDGSALCELVNRLGGSVDMSQLSRAPADFENNCFRGITAAHTQLNVPRLISSKELSDPDVQALAVMGYLAKFQRVAVKESGVSSGGSRKNERVYVRGIDLNNVHVNKAATFEILAVDPTVNVEQDVTVEVVQLKNNQKIPVKLNVTSSGGTGAFLPTVASAHELRVYLNGSLIECCPMLVEVFPDISRILYSGIAPCALGSLVEVLISSNGAASGGDVEIEAVSPAGARVPCDVSRRRAAFRASFVPRHVGEWQINVTHARDHISGSPFTCYVYDPTKIKLRTPVRYEPGRESQIAVDTRDAGWGKLNMMLELNGRRLPFVCDERGDGLYIFTFHPSHSGTLNLQLSFNDNQIKGSPFHIQVGNEPMTGSSGFYFRSESSLAGRSSSADSPFRDPLSLGGATSNGRNTPDSTFTLGDAMARLDGRDGRALSPRPLTSPEGRREFREAALHRTESPHRSEESHRVFSPKFASSLINETTSLSDRKPEFRLVSERVVSPTSTRLIQSCRSLTSRVTTPDIIAGHSDPLRPNEERGVSPQATTLYGQRLHSASLTSSMHSSSHSGLANIGNPVRNGSSCLASSPTLHQSTNGNGDTIYRSVLAKASERPLSPASNSDKLPSGIFHAEYSEGRRTPNSPTAGDKLASSSFNSRDTTTRYASVTYDGSHAFRRESRLGVTSPEPDRTQSPAREPKRSPPPYAASPTSTAGSRLMSHRPLSPASSGPNRIAATSPPLTKPGSIFDKMDSFFETPADVLKRHVTARTSSSEPLRHSPSSPSAGGLDEVDRVKTATSPTREPSNPHEALRMEYIRGAQNPSGMPRSFAGGSADVGVVSNGIQPHQHRDIASDVALQASSPLVTRTTFSVDRSHSPLHHSRTEILSSPVTTSVVNSRVPAAPTSQSSSTVAHLPDQSTAQSYQTRSASPSINAFRASTIAGTAATATVADTPRITPASPLPSSLVSERDVATAGASDLRRSEQQQQVVVMGREDTHLDSHFVTSTVTRRESTVPLNDYQPPAVHREGDSTIERRRHVTIPIGEKDSSSTLRNTAHSRQRSNYGSAPPPPPPPIPNDGQSSYSLTKGSPGGKPSPAAAPGSPPPEGLARAGTKGPVTVSFSSSSTSSASSASATPATVTQAIVSPERVAAELRLLQPERLQMFRVKQPLLIDVVSESVPFDAQLLQVFIRGPSGPEVSCRVDQLIPKIAQVLIEAREVGDHRIRIVYGGVDVACFQGHGFSPENISVDRIPDGIVGRPVRFRINGNDAGSGSLELMVNNGNVGSKVESVRDQLYEASFVPHMAAPHEVDIKFNGYPVPGSPWRCNITESTQQEKIAQKKAMWEQRQQQQQPQQQQLHRSYRTTVHETRSLERPLATLVDARSFPTSVPCRKRQSVHVQVPTGSAETDLKVILSRVENLDATAPCPYTVIRKSPTMFAVEFNVGLAGAFSLDAHFKGHRVQGCPLHFKAYDAQRIHMPDVDKVVEINRPVNFHVDASGAGEGQLEISVNRGEIANQVEVLSEGRCRVSFTPVNPGDYVVDIKFNGEMIPGCPVNISAHAPIKYAIDMKALRAICANEPVCFDIPLPRGKRELLRVGIIDSSHNSIPVSLKSSEVDVVTVEFTPKQVGAHIVSVDYDGAAVGGSPCTVKCFDPRLVAVDGVQSADKGETVQFVVDAGSSGDGNLEITVTSEGGQVVSTQVSQLGGGRFSLCFVPQEEAAHLVAIAFNGKPVPGSPFTVVVTDPAPRQPAVHPAQPGPVCAAVNSPTSLILKGSVHSQHLYARVTNPEGSVVPFTLKEHGDDTFGVEFTPAAVGEYRMEVRYLDKPIPGSPFVCKVYDISQIRVSDVPKPALVGSSAAFLVETSGAGPGNLEVMVNQGRVPTTPQAKTSTLYSIHFTPTEVEDHVIDVRFNGHHVPGSPFTCPVLDLSRLKLIGDPIEKVPVNKPCRLLLSAGGQNVSHLVALVIGPNNNKIDVKQSHEDETHAVEFTPKDVGDYFVDLRIDSTPLLATPLGLKAYDTSKVKVSGITEGISNEPVYFNIDASDAGAGNLEIFVTNNDSRVPNYVQSEGNARFRVNFKPIEAKSHEITVKFNSILVPGSPFRVNVKPASEDVNSGKTSEAASQQTSVQSENGSTAIQYRQENTSQKAEGTSTAHQVEDNNFSEPSASSKSSTAPSARTEAISNKHIVPHIEEGIPTSWSNCQINSQALKSVAINTPLTFSINTIGLTPKKCCVQLQGPDGMESAAKITKTENGFEATLSPSHVGPNQVFVYLDDMQVSGSPFTCNVFDVQRVRVSGLHRGYVSRSLTFVVDASQAGEGTLELVVSTKRGSVRAEVSTQARGVYDVTFTPTDATEHYVNVTFNDLEIPGNPFRIEVLDEKALASQRAGKPTLKGSAVQRGLCGTKNIFEIFEAEQPVSIRVSKGSTEAQCIVTKISEKTYRAEYLPCEVGSYLLEVLVGGRVAATNNVQVVNPARVRAMDIEDAIVHRRVSFRVDTTKAGQGTLEVGISAASGRIPLQLDEVAVGLYKATFHPHSASPHKIEIRYNGHVVPGFPYVIQVRDPSNTMIAHGAGLKSAQVGRAARFNIETGGHGDAKDFDIIVSSAGSPLPVRCYLQKDKSLLVEWSPVEIGPHRIEAFYRGEPLQGSPFKCEAFDATQVRFEQEKSEVAAQRKTNICSVNQRVCFKLNRRDAGYAELDVTATSPLGKNLPIEVRSADDGELIELTPAVAGKYRIAITYGGVPVPGSPVTFVAQAETPATTHQKLTAAGPGLTEAQKGIMASFRVGFGAGREIPLSERLHTNLEVSVKGPAGQDAEYTVDQEDDGSWTVSYLPIETGLYTIRLRINGKEVAGSPYKVRVGEGQQLKPVGGWESVCDSEGVMSGVIGKELSMAFEVSSDTVDSELSASLTDRLSAEAELPDGRRAPVQIEKAGTRWTLKYLPKVSGEHRLHLAHNSTPLVQSPLFIHVRRKPSRGAADGNISRSASKITSDSTTGTPERGSITSKPTDNDDQLRKSSTVRVPSSATEAVVGCTGHAASVTTGTAATSTSAHRTGSSKDVVHQQHQQKAMSTAATTTMTTESGENVISALSLAARDDDASASQSSWLERIVVRGDGLSSARLGEVAQFVVDATAAGTSLVVCRPKATLVTDRGEFPIEVTRSSESGNVFRCQYTPQQTGHHLVAVVVDEKHLPGSPFRVRIGPLSDAQRVICSGDGLSNGGVVGKPIKAFLDTRAGGSGELSAHCLGPSKMARCELISHGDGTFQLLVTALESGKHMLSVKYGGQHVPGSPFTLRVAGAPDASRVRVYGPGIEPGVLALYQSRFVCDTRGAGAGQLTVRVRGPKGAFRVEMARENSKDRTILCKYDPTEPGDYRIEVKWSGIHVPGSPFIVMIFDTQDELTRHLQNLLQQSGVPALSSRADSAWGGSQYEPVSHPSTTTGSNGVAVAAATSSNRMLSNTLNNGNTSAHRAQQQHDRGPI